MDNIFPVEIGIFQRKNMEKYRAVGRLAIRRPCPVKFFLVSRLDLFELCVQDQRNGRRWNFFTL